MEIKVIDRDRTSLTVELNGTYVKSGGSSHSSRKVFLFPNFVVKLDCGADQNRGEANFYENIETEDLKYFPKLLGYGYTDASETDTYLIQERIEVDSFKKATPQQIELLTHLKEKYGLDDMFLCGQASYYDSSRMQVENHNCVPVGDDSVMIWDMGL